MKHAAHKPEHLTDPTDIIIQGCRQNDLQSQEQLYKLCYPGMIRICYRYAGDMDGAGIIYNNAMLRAFKNIGSYKHHGKLMGWIKTIVVNCCLDFIKQKNKFVDQPLMAEHENEVSVPAETLNRVSAKEIQRIINELPKATAAVFNLYIYENFTHKQIGESLGISEGTSKWHVNEARKRLKTMLQEFQTH